MRRTLVTALEILGLGSVLYGLYLLAPPITYVVGGLLVLGFGVAIEIKYGQGTGGAPRRRA